MADARRRLLFHGSMMILLSSLGTQGGMALAGAGREGSAVAEILIFAALAAFSLAMLVCCTPILQGLRARRTRDTRRARIRAGAAGSGAPHGG